MSDLAMLNKCDPGVRPIVTALVAGGVDTFSSCDGTPGHLYHEATVVFRGNDAEGQRAAALVRAARHIPRELRRVWPANRENDTPPWWELTFALPGEAALLREPSDRETRISLVSVLTDRNRIALNALRSIAANTCCVGCGEAGKVALNTLDTLARLEGRDSK